MFIKAAILLEWTHILVPQGLKNPFFYWACHVMIWVNSLFYISVIIVTNLSCIPRDKMWRRWVRGTCINFDAFNISLTALDLLFNVLILLLPHRVIWRLSLSTKQKVGVSFIFSVGIMYVTFLIHTSHSTVDADKTNFYIQTLWLCCRATCSGSLYESHG